MTQANLTLKVLAPLTGRVVPLSQVPDPIFAAETVGPGFAIDPLSPSVVAPFDGEITQLHRCHHAIALRHSSGIEILIHVGIDTVMLRGEGFSPQVQVGQRVRAGDVLLVCDWDKIASKAVSLITPVLLVSPAAPLQLAASPDAIIQPGQIFFTVGATKANTAAVASDALATVNASVRLKNPLGLHARPAAVLAARARTYSAQIDITLKQKSTDARSVTGLLSLNSRWGDVLRLSATGSDARHAIDGIIDSVLEGLGEPISDTPPLIASDSTAPSRQTTQVPPEPDVVTGVGASRGIALGPLFQRPTVLAQLKRHGDGQERERQRFSQALSQLKELMDTELHHAGATAQSIQRAHRELLSDPKLLTAIDGKILADQSAAHATAEALADAIRELRAMDNALLAERATDLADIRNRLIALIEPDLAAHPRPPPRGSIWLAEELTPSEVAALRPGEVAGLVSVQGGATGHVAILARALGVPAVLGVAPSLLTEANGTLVLVDGEAGYVRLRPNAAQVQAAEASIVANAQRQATDLKTAHLPAITTDGRRIEVAANIQTLADAEQALRAGADGVGLLRSEFLFDGRTQAPTETEQASVYASIGRVMGKERVVVMRTLDVGGDKPLAYWPMAPEANPFLGLRGVRLSLRHPEQLETQLRAMLTAATECQLHVLFPMVGLVEEITELAARTKVLAKAVQAPVKIGVMVEIPSAVLLAEQMSPQVDFFSIGTNDLTQYTLAMDRGHPQLAQQADAMHPAVLKLIQMTVAAAHPHKRWVGICGALAAEELAWPLLVGLGIDELSMPGVVIAQAKAAIRRFNTPDCQSLAQAALQCATAAEVRSLLKNFVQSHSPK
jgi:multiphosphoryl transfer protein